MDKINSVEIKELKLEHIPNFVKNLSAESPEYLKHFTAFELSNKVFVNLLTKVVKDKYFGIFYGEEIVGFYMLRGFDEGFEIPSYGVIILSKFSNKGLSKLTLYHAFALCRLNKVKKLMLKVRPENTYAKKLYESFGFEKTGFDNKNGNFIYHKSLSS
jgi:ribosomal protein S18 acetylase RimI-like enzyme